MTTATSIKIDDELKQRVQQIAATRQRSAHWIMREAIREYVEREEKREALRKRPWHPFVAASISWPIILRPVGPLKIWKLNLGNGRTISATAVILLPCIILMAAPLYCWQCAIKVKPVTDRVPQHQYAIKLTVERSRSRSPIR